jgi:NAD(P)-dependent dehydrogenase (short-subunit alcohol dehydrogenase family)
MTRKASTTEKKQRNEQGPLEEPNPPFAVQHQNTPGLESKLEPQPRYEAEAYKAADKLKDRVALITGGDSGIWRAVAVMFAREGADVAINYLSEEEADAKKTEQEVKDCGRACLLLPGDLSEWQTCDEIVQQTVDRFGKLDILVSNAAYQRRKDELEDLTDEELEHTFSTNVFAYIRLARAAAPHMKPGAAIIATSSETGILGSEKLPD